jgi:hypothetical protein
MNFMSLEVIPPGFYKKTTIGHWVVCYRNCSSCMVTVAPVVVPVIRCFIDANGLEDNRLTWVSQPKIIIRRDEEKL